MFDPRNGGRLLRFLPQQSSDFPSSSCKDAPANALMNYQLPCAEVTRFEMNRIREWGAWYIPSLLLSSPSRPEVGGSTIRTSVWDGAGSPVTRLRRLLAFQAAWAEGCPGRRLPGPVPSAGCHRGPGGGVFPTFIQGFEVAVESSERPCGAGKFMLTVIMRDSSLLSHQCNPVIPQALSGIYLKHPMEGEAC